MSTPGQAIFVRDMVFKLTSVVYWRVLISVKQRQVEIYNVQESPIQFTHDYTIRNQVYVEMTGIYRKLDYNKQKNYITTEVFTNDTVLF